MHIRSTKPSPFSGLFYLKKGIKLCDGKEKNLRQLLPLGIMGGCNYIMTGNYLTTLGRNTALDLEMIMDLGLQAAMET